MNDNLTNVSNDFRYLTNVNAPPGNLVSEIIVNGFFTVNKKWIVVSWNKAAEKLLKIPAKDILGKNLWETLTGIFSPGFKNKFHQAQLKDIPGHFKNYILPLNTWFDVFTFYLEDHLSVSFNITKVLQARYSVPQLTFLDDLYRFVAEVTSDALWDWNTDGKEILWIDGGHKRAFGYPIENTLIPQSFWERRIHPDDRDRILSELDKMIHDSLNPVWEVEYRFKRRSGEYAYVHDRGHIFRNNDNLGIRIIGATQDINTRKLSEIQLLDERRTKQLEITSAVIASQERERAAIGRELHDNLNQVLAITKMYIEMSLTDWPEKKSYMEKSRALISDVIAQVRKISKSMVVPGMDGNILSDNIRNLIEDLKQVHPVSIGYQIHGLNMNEIDKKKQLNIFRIIQEQVNNILKHSQATKASISLSKEKNRTQLLIKDNGKGCDTAIGSNGLGLQNITTRAEICGGKAEIQSKPGEGFLLKVSL